MAYKLRRRNLRPLCLACAAILGALCLLYWALTSKRLARDDRRPDTAPVVNPGDPAPVRPAAIRALPRAIYPYSVIRGGAYSAAELVAALRADPMAAAHYAGFDPSQTRMTRAPAAAAVYVSYRQGNRIYWTRRKVHLAAGEPLLTDGVHTARARCGNRISPTPAEPAQAPEPDTDLDIPEPATVPPDVFSVTKVVHEIFPALLGNWLPPGRPGGSVGPAPGGAGALGGMAFPTSGGESAPPGYSLPLLPEVTLPPSMPNVWPIDFTTMPAPPVGPGFGWLQPIPLPGFVAGSTTGPPPGGTPPGFTPIPGITPIPGFTPIPGIPPVPGVPPSPTDYGQVLPSPAGTSTPAQALLPKDSPLPFGAELPEPATATLLLCGAAILAYRRFSRRRLD